MGTLGTYRRSVLAGSPTAISFVRTVIACRTAPDRSRGEMALDRAMIQLRGRGTSLPQNTMGRGPWMPDRSCRFLSILIAGK